MNLQGTVAAAIAKADQDEARQRELDRKVQRVAVVFLLVFAVVGVYATLAAFGVLPAAPWSALG